jgi:branched-chain amino acid transport system ATP-binding protein
MLEIRGLFVSRGAGDILRSVELRAQPGELTVLLGPNGAGKTTLLDAISGLVRHRAGYLLVNGVELGGVPRVRRARMGIRHVEQGRTVFPELTARENLTVAAPARDHGEVVELFPELAPRMDVRAGLLSGGEQQMLVIARALLRARLRHRPAAGPGLLLLDELSLGLAPVIVGRLLPTVRALAQRGMTVLLVEQFAHLVLPIADVAYVLDRGRITFSGTPGQLQDNPGLLHEAYLAGPGTVPTAQTGPDRLPDAPGG